MTIKVARKTIWNAFKKDPDFKRSYIDNVAMMIYDRVLETGNLQPKEVRDKLAEDIIDRVFG